MATIYAVFKEGSYRHECVGLFTSEDHAALEADHAVAREKDAHHWFSVVPFELNERTPSADGEGYSYPAYQERPPIYEVRKDLLCVKPLVITDRREGRRHGA